MSSMLAGHREDHSPWKSFSSSLLVEILRDNTASSAHPSYVDWWLLCASSQVFTLSWAFYLIYLSL